MNRLWGFLKNLVPAPMDFFSIVWVMRIDPKDPNARIGQDMMIFTHQKFLRNAWLADGICVRHFGYNADEYVRVKWYFPCLVLCPRRNLEMKEGEDAGELSGT